MTTGFVDRLAAARIGDTFNQYADSELRRARLERYLRERCRTRILLVGEAPGYRGARVSGIPFTSERQLSGRGPAEATATIVQRTLAELGLENAVLLWNLVPTHPGTAESNRQPSRAEVEQSDSFLRELSAGSSRSAGSHMPGSAAPTSDILRTAAPLRSAPASPRRCWDRVERWSASRFVATRSCSLRP
jgi:uracil DNA glycosylase superfamily protein